MTFLDYFVICIVLISIVSSAVHGLIRSSLALVTAIVGVILAARLYSYGGTFFGWLVTDPRLANFLGFVGIFALVALGGTILSFMLRHSLQSAGISWLDKLLGAGFGLVRGWLIASTVYLGLTAFPFQIEAVQKAVFAPYLTYGSQAITYAASDEVRTKFWANYEKLQSGWGKAERSSRQ